MNKNLRFENYHFLLFIISLLLYSCSGSGNNPNILIKGAYAEAPLMEGNAIVAYMAIKNLTNTPLIVSNISCEEVTTTFFHETKVDKLSGMTVMSKLDNLNINPRSELVFKPGGNHIMMMGPNLSTNLLKEINCDLQTINGTTNSITFPIR